LTVLFMKKDLSNFWLYQTKYIILRFHTNGNVQLYI